MVKINDIASFDQISAATGTQAANPEGAMSFFDVLRNAVNEIDSPEANKIRNTAPTSNSTEVAQNNISDDVVSVMDQTGDLLEALEGFAARLGSCANTLKQVDPEVKRIEDMTSRLEQNLEKFRGLDDELSGLAQQVVTQSKVEVIKFQRGDYV